jgi:hypothetical protein
MDQAGSFSKRSALVYAELIGQDGKSLTRFKVKLENGVGSADLFFGANVVTGNYTLVAYTSWMKNFSETNFYRETITIINPLDKLPIADSNSKEISQHTSPLPPSNNGLKIQLNKNEYGPREKVTLSLLSSGLESMFLSVSVRLNDSLSNSLEKSMVELRSAVGQSQTIKFLPDARGELITGTVTNKTTGLPLTNSLISLSSPSKNFEFLVSLTDSSGRYFFNANKIGSDFFLLKILDHDNKEFTIQIEDDFLTDNAHFIPSKLQINSGIIKSIGKRNLASQIENVFYAAKKDSLPEVKSRRRFFNTPDKVYRLDDFTRFPTMDDIFREIIPEVVVRQKTGNFSLILRNVVTGERFNNAPLVLIDGVPIADANVLMNYNPALISTATVVTQHYYYGALECDGILSIETYNGNAENLPIDEFVRVAYNQPLHPKIYFTPNYDSKELARIPDFRTQLYWNPGITMSADESETLTFFTGDAAGEYLIEVLGISATGEKIYYREKLVVR